MKSLWKAQIANLVFFRHQQHIAPLKKSIGSVRVYLCLNAWNDLEVKFPPIASPIRWPSTIDLGLADVIICHVRLFCLTYKLIASSNFRKSDISAPVAKNIASNTKPPYQVAFLTGLPVKTCILYQRYNRLASISVFGQKLRPAFYCRPNLTTGKDS